jgi:acyl carrier protein
MRDPVVAAPVAPVPDGRPILYSREPMSIPGSSLEAEIIAIVKRVSRRPVEPAAHSDLVLDLGFDSLLVFELIAELEDRFDVSIPLNDIEKVRTIAQVDAHLRDLIEQQAGSR